jgi:hypothetical protein
MLTFLAIVARASCSRASLDEDGFALLQLRSPVVAKANCQDELHKAVTLDLGMEHVGAINENRAVYDRVMDSLSGGMHPQTFLLFFGYPRSGHSMVASLLDAHPEAAVANEFDAVKAYMHGESRDLLFKKLLAVSTAYKIVGRCQAGYHFVVPGATPQPFDHGRTLRVLGDKMAGVTSRKRMGKAELGEFQRYVGVNVSLIHVVRNPFDMVASRFAAGTEELLDRWRLQHNASNHPYLADHPIMVEGNKDLMFRLNYSVDLVIMEMTYNMKVRGWIRAGELADYRWTDVLLDDFLRFPASQLKHLSEFLGLDCNEDDYLTRASSIVRTEEHKSRDEMIWPEQIYDRLNGALAKIRAEYPDGAYLWTPRYPRHVGTFQPLQK